MLWRWQSKPHKTKAGIKSVGAGLPAMAVYQSRYSVTDPPPSRASQLPHLFCVVFRNPDSPPH
ncbi:hypothetical protein E4O98_21890 [Pseudomonas sp. W2Jun17]|nr:hypothetical protein [Pseudomonas sp. W2Jun17]